MRQAQFYTRISGPLHRMPPAAKLAIVLGLVVGTALIPVTRPAWLLAPAAVLLAALLASGLPWIGRGGVLRRLVLLEPLVLGVTALVLLEPGGGRLMLVLAAKATLCLLAMLLLTGTTPFVELLAVLRKVRVPALLVTTIALMYRYLFVLADEAQRMRRARASRTFKPTRAGTWWTLATVIGQLFVRASERAERVYAAMVARGWR